MDSSQSKDMFICKSDIEYKLLYSVIVAGKSAKFADNVLKKFFSSKDSTLSPFEFIKSLISKWGLNEALRLCKSGNYTKIEKAFTQIVNEIDPMTCSIEDLEKIHGIGPKTSRFFMLWTRPDSRVAALDTHILKWLKSLGYKDIPKSTPSGARYYKIEQLFLKEADNRNMTPAKLDAMVWDSYSNSNYIQDNLFDRIEGTSTNAESFSE